MSDNNVIQTVEGDNKPISTIAYLGLMILFMVPLIGLIASIVLGVSSSNINLKNFGRAYMIIYGVTIVIAIIMLIISAVLGFSMIAYLES